MKILKILTLGCMISLLFINMNCEDPPDPDPEPELPPITHEGKNTFGCLVNGEVWVPEVLGPTIFRHRLSCEYIKGSFNISANIMIIDKKIDQSILIGYFNTIKDTGNYKLSSVDIGFGHFYDYNNKCDCYTDSLNTGFLEITFLDTLNRIIAGKFNFSMTDPVCDTIKITDGRFDVKYPQ